MGNMLKINVHKDYTISRMFRCFHEIIRLLLFPPKLATLYKIHSDHSNFRFWSLIDRTLRSRMGKLLRPLWRFFPKLIVYRLFVLPLFLLFMIRRSLIALKSKDAKHLNKSTGISLIHQFFWILDVVLENLGIQPERFFLYRLYLSQNSLYAKGTLDINNIMFLANLASLAQRQKTTRRYPVTTITNNKLEFNDFLKRNNYPASEIIAHFSLGNVEWAEHPICLPKQDLFIKPVRGNRSIGASVVIFNQESNLYNIQKPINPFTKQHSLDGYPESPLSGDHLVRELRELSKTLPLLLEHRFHSHSSLVNLCGEDESLVTARILTARELHGRSNFIFAYLRLSAHTGGVALPAFGGIAALIDPTSGQITRASFNDEELIRHPFTNQKFEGFSVPFAKEAIRDCLKVHDSLAEEEVCSLPIVGFDITFTDTGFFFMEANAPPGMAFQKIKTPLLFDKDFTVCFQSYLNSVENYSIIHPDPIIRWETAN